MAISILIGGVDFTAAYKPRSLEITQRTGSDRSGFKFRLENPATEPPEGADVVIYEDEAQTVKATAGRIRRPGREAIAGDDGDGVEVFAFNVEGVGWTYDIERRPPYTQVHNGKTTGFCARDVVSRVPGFSGAGITTGGRLLKVFEARQEKLTRTLDRLAKIEGAQWWVDDDKVVHLDQVGSTMAPFALTDDNWREIAGLTLKTEPDTSNLANYGKMSYKGKYSGGTVNVYAASNQITGNGTAWASRVMAGSKFYLDAAPGEVYTVEAVLSDTTIRLSSNFANATGTQTALAYTIDEIPRATQKVELASVEAMAAITGDDGIVAAIIEPPPGSMTYEEATDFLAAEMRSRANVPVNIPFSSDSVRIPGRLAAGMTVLIRLTKWKIDTSLQIRQLVKKDTGAVTDDGRPVWAYEFRFEALLYDLASQLRRREEAAVEASSSDSGQADEVFGVTERVRVTERIRLTDPLSFREAVIVSEAFSLTDVPRWAPFVWGPSVKVFDTQADWNTGTIERLVATAGGVLKTPDLSFVRNSVAWMFGVSYPANAPRFPSLSGVVGVMCEEGDTNRLGAGSEDFQIGWVASDSATATVTAGRSDPFGGTGAYRIQTIGGASVAKYLRSVGTSVSGQIYPVWCWLKNNGPASVRLSNALAVASPISAGSEWQLAKLEVGTGNGSTTARFEFRTVNISDNLDIDVMLPVMGTKAYALSYLPPGVTRAAETLTVPTQGLITPQEGTVIIGCYISRLQGANDRYLIRIPDGSGGFYLLINNANKWVTRPGSAAAIQSTAATTTGAHIAGIAWDAAGYELWVDGVLLASGTGTLPYASFGSTANLGSYNSSAGHLNDSIRYVATYLERKSQASMAAGTASLAGLPPDFTAYINFQNGQMEVTTQGTWLSPWMIQYSPNIVKIATLLSTVPAGANVTVQWRSANYGQTAISAWYADLADVPDDKYIQARIILSSAGAAPTVDKLSFTPNKSPLRWSRSQWGGADTFDSQADWQAWTLSNTDATTTPGSLRLTAGQNSGTAVSPWMKNRSRTVVKVVTATQVTPGSSTITMAYRTSLDGTEINASPWVADIKATPDQGFIQYRATLAGNATDRPELQKLVVKPN